MGSEFHFTSIPLLFTHSVLLFSFRQDVVIVVVVYVASVEHATIFSLCIIIRRPLRTTDRGDFIFI